MRVPEYSIIVTNIPAASGIGSAPGSHHARFIRVLHRQHAVVDDAPAKSTGLRNLPSKTWLLNSGWMPAADLAARCRLLGLYHFASRPGSTSTHREPPQHDQ